MQASVEMPVSAVREGEDMSRNKIPNNPAQAYIAGKLDGTRENMDIVGMVLLDKMGFHPHEETTDEHDQKSLQYLWDCIVSLKEEICAGTVTRRNFKDVLADEYNVYFD